MVFFSSENSKILNKSLLSSVIGSHLERIRNPLKELLENIAVEFLSQFQVSRLGLKLFPKQAILSIISRIYQCNIYISFENKITISFNHQFGIPNNIIYLQQVTRYKDSCKYYNLKNSDGVIYTISPDEDSLLNACIQGYHLSQEEALIDPLKKTIKK